MEFSISTVNLINALFIAAGIGVCGLCFLQITSSGHLRREVRRYFQVFFLLILLYISTHLARQLMDGLPGAGVRTALDDRNEKIGKKIREATLEKIPYMLVLGDRDVENATVSVRTRAGEDKGAMSLADFTAAITEEIRSRSR